MCEIIKVSGYIWDGVTYSSMDEVEDAIKRRIDSMFAKVLPDAECDIVTETIEVLRDRLGACLNAWNELDKMRETPSL